MIPKYIMAGLYLFSILLGNYFVIEYGILHFNIEDMHRNILFSLSAPAGVLWIGLTFSFRDLLQRFWGTFNVWIWMSIAVFITYYYNQTIAIAAVLSFLISETIDWIIFTITKMELKYRIIISNLIAASIDSFVFVTLVFGTLWDVILGQSILKIIFSLLIIPILPLFNKLYNLTANKNKYNGN